MTRGGHGGRSPTPNDDRSRSMNPQDSVGQAAMANTARQRGDDDYDDGYDEDAEDEHDEDTDDEQDDRIYFGEVSRKDSEKPQKPKPAVTDADLGFYGGGWNHSKTKPKPEDK